MLRRLFSYHDNYLAEDANGTETRAENKEKRKQNKHINNLKCIKNATNSLIWFTTHLKRRNNIAPNKQTKCLGYKSNLFIEFSCVVVL